LSFNLSTNFMTGKSISTKKFLEEHEQKISIMEPGRNCRVYCRVSEYSLSESSETILAC
jgi:hypothetical protein